MTVPPASEPREPGAGAGTLPAPDCEIGYPTYQLEQHLGKTKFQRLMRWMYGQTYALCEGRGYDHDTRQYTVRCDGVAHGPVIYTSDVDRFIRKLPIID